MTKFTQMLFTGGLLITASTAAQAALVVDFDGTNPDLITTSVAFGTSAQTQRATTTLPDDTVRSSVPYGTALLTNGVGTYEGPTLIGGAYMNAVYTTTQTDAFQSTWGSLAAGTTLDVLRLRRNGSGSNNDSSATVTRAAYTFVTSGAGPYKFDATSTLALTGAIGTHNNTSEEGRWLVVNDGTLYVSSAAINFTTNTATNFTLANPDEINWAAWTPGTDLALGSLTYNVAGTSLQSIQRAGFYIDKSGSTGTNPDFSLFRADLAAVPEPGALAVLGVAGLWMTARRRRQG